jgi:hypothetical protein
MKDLVFLTREGCVNTVTMRANLDVALKTLGLPNDYQFIDADTLASSDPRGGYGTPTVLHQGQDLFGMEEPPIPHPPATWRLYPGGVPPPAAIQERLELILKKPST